MFSGLLTATAKDGRTDLLADLGTWEWEGGLNGAS
jgi:hypothetical protein